MKKQISILLSAIFTLLLFVSCGDSGDKLVGKWDRDTYTTVTSSTKSVMVQDSEFPSQAITIEDYIASDEIQEQLESVKSSMVSSGIDVDVIGEDNKLIYVYTYSDQFDEDAVDALAEQLESAMSAQASTFEDVAASLKEETDVEDPVVEVRYVNADGSEIYSQEFTAQ